MKELALNCWQASSYPGTRLTRGAPSDSRADRSFRSWLERDDLAELIDPGRFYPTGSLRLVYRTPDWEDFVRLAVTEIRQFGGASIQVARRLRAMLENLTEVWPPERTALLCGELALLQRSAGRFFPEPEDQALADVSDLQGVGGKLSGDKGLAGDTPSTIAGPGLAVLLFLGTLLALTTIPICHK